MTIKRAQAGALRQDGATPVLVWDLPTRLHRKIEDNVWNHPKVGSKGNCGACHLDAEQGTFEDAAMRLPR